MAVERYGSVAYERLELAPRAHVLRWLGVRRSTCMLAWCSVAYLALLAVGAAVFALLEAPSEALLRRQLTDSVARFLREHKCVPESDLEDLITEVVLANNRGVSASKNISSGSNWSFGQSFFFSATVVTTIGYGHVTPLSEGGKIFCVVFALIGIPLTLVILSAFVEKLMVPSTLALQWMNSRLGHLYQPFNIRLFHLALVGLLIVCCFFLVPAAVFSRVEDGWSFLDSLYYCFISLTTVGLGDYIPGDRPGQEYRPLYKVAITGYLLVGLVMMMWFLTVFAEIPQLNFGIMFLHQSDEGTSDPEKMRLSGAGAGPKYTQQMENHVKASSRPVEETPSPEETTPVHARQK
ncbi:potassium channel subfamily K member 1-like isoform X1 [Pollicipes pollicipes]|uniref:potassium channel subfamily K member 1-like isoform X1 n=1 Tax=Pollicipes pollicipes TaxID=41117 RepID=UPI00188555F2|nr:potassium channel subfamily K member 1-like isoform X1 [Pollicipes pollicipes]XP_037089619.1 potassium channel subfamily K member 1-like isoform X1 [Pollicipes pollicipes]XP_037089626.1 potassium channel subfamily K member 1-like isoform X1 [Pollicipes pollicipes]